MTSNERLDVEGEEVSASPLPDLALGAERLVDADAARIELVEERLTLSKRRVVSGRVRVSTLTERHDETAEIELDRYRVEVTRVPVGRVVDMVPAARSEGDTTIVPIVEERLVMVKQFFLKEEVHIRHVVERETARKTVSLLRQRAVVERQDGSGRLTPDDDPTA